MVCISLYHLPRYLVPIYLVFQGKCKNVARKKKISMFYISFIFIACKERFGSLIQNQKWLFDTLVFFSDPHELATTDMRQRGVCRELGIKIPCLTTQSENVDEYQKSWITTEDLSLRHTQKTVIFQGIQTRY